MSRAVTHLSFFLVVLVASGLLQPRRGAGVARADEFDAPPPVRDGEAEEPPDIPSELRDTAQPEAIVFPESATRNPRVLHFIRTWTGNQGFLREVLIRSGRYLPAMERIFRDKGLPQELLYLCVLESGFSPVAYSPTKTVGLWQFTARTGAAYGLSISAWLDERRDPIKSTLAAAAYLKDLHVKFGDWLTAVAAFNAGAGAVQTALHGAAGKVLTPLDADILQPGTRDFVAKFVALVLVLRESARHGLDTLAHDSEITYDEVVLGKPVKLETLALLADTSVAQIQRLNPALLRDRTPPDDTGFPVRLPRGNGEIFSQSYGALSDLGEKDIVSHRVQRGETLFRIARRYGKSIGQLMRINRLTSDRLRTGQDLIIGFDSALSER